MVEHFYTSSSRNEWATACEVDKIENVLTNAMKHKETTMYLVIVFLFSGAVCADQNEKFPGQLQHGQL